MVPLSRVLLKCGKLFVYNTINAVLTKLITSPLKAYLTGEEVPQHKFLS